jgi:hypothetical protein
MNDLHQEPIPSGDPFLAAEPDNDDIRPPVGKRTKIALGLFVLTWASLVGWCIWLLHSGAHR